MNQFLVTVDINMSFAAAANGLTVGLNGPTHLTGNPTFDASLPGSWLVDLSHVDLSRVQINGRTVDGALLPSPFTPNGDRPEGPAWYAMPTVQYAVELGFDVAPTEAYVRTRTGRYLDPWYKRLRDAYIATMADLGVTTSMVGQEFLEAMARSKQTDPTMALLATAIKATAKGGIGKLRQRSRGQVPYYEEYPALNRETWRPGIRAAVLANQRIGLHRKLMTTAATACLYPVAIATDAIVYPSPGPSPLDVRPPHTPEGKPVPGTFRLGISPGMVKRQGTQRPSCGRRGSSRSAASSSISPTSSRPIGAPERVGRTGDVATKHAPDTVTTCGVGTRSRGGPPRPPRTQTHPAYTPHTQAVDQW
ncbi:hypothetical protein ACFRAI_42675 [Streptomyces sp. NPDC056637]|uniref:hypothetical protein n=1 Tax=unclassified Streptomyces TaxID=2593676 RepID=UPI0036949588